MVFPKTTELKGNVNTMKVGEITIKGHRATSKYKMGFSLEKNEQNNSDKIIFVSGSGW